MEAVGGVDVVGLEGQVELVVPQVVGLGAVPQPGELQGVGGVAVAQIDNGKIRVFDAAHLPQLQGFFIKRHAFLQVQDV